MVTKKFESSILNLYTCELLLLDSSDYPGLDMICRQI